MSQLYILSKDNLKILDILTISTYDMELDSDFYGKTAIELARKPKVEEGDYVFIKEEQNIIYKGITSTIDNVNGEELHVLNAIEIENLFDRKIIIENEALKTSTGIEDFLSDQIIRNFVDSPDDFLNMNYISVTVLTHTIVNASVDVSDGGIYNLATYIANARENYNVYLDFEFSKEKLNITIQYKNHETFNLDASVTDVVNYEEIYTVDVLAKLTVVWKVPDTIEDEVITEVGETSILNYYLLSDRTITTDIADVDRASGDIDVIYIEAEELDEVEEQVYIEFQNNAYEHSVTADILRTSKIYPESQFYIGHKCNIKTKSYGIKESLISNISYKNNNQYIKVKFGNMAITLIEKLRKEKVR